MASDTFFSKLNKTKFSVILDLMSFLLMDYTLLNNSEKDRQTLYMVKDDGFIVIHDCNLLQNTRGKTTIMQTPARGYWNGTTWKAFLKYRFDNPMNSC